MNQTNTGFPSPRMHLYERIAQEVRAQVQGGEFGPATLLPSEVDLAKAYGTSRMTVKRALGLLREEGLIDARRGFGWFVTGGDVRHSLGERNTIDQGIIAMGLTPGREILEFSFQPPDGHVRALLRCDLTLKIVRLNLAEGEPVAYVTTWCASDAAARVSRGAVERSSLDELLTVDVMEATQVVRAVGAGPIEADHLNIRTGAPCLRSERTTFAAHRRPVMFGIAIFPGHRTEYVIDLPVSREADSHPRFLPVADNIEDSTTSEEEGGGSRSPDPPDAGISSPL